MTRDTMASFSSGRDSAIMIVVATSESLPTILRPFSYSSPSAELHAALRLHPVADGNDDVEVVVFDLAFNLPIALKLNCRKFALVASWVTAPCFRRSQTVLCNRMGV